MDICMGVREDEEREGSAGHEMGRSILDLEEVDVLASLFLRVVQLVSMIALLSCLPRPEARRNADDQTANPSLVANRHLYRKISSDRQSPSSLLPP
jgi:hypothetical protein